MAEEKIKVLGLWASPFVARVTMALDLKGITYEYMEEDLKNKSPLLLQSNPVYKKVPVLLHNGIAICESLVILEYIDEAWPANSERSPLLPKDPYLRARSRFWAAFIDDKVGSSLRATYRTGGEDFERAKKELQSHISVLEDAFNVEFAGGPFFGGKDVGYLDIVLGSRAVWFSVVEEIVDVKAIDPKNAPSLSSWLQRFLQIGCVVRALPKHKNLLAYAKAVQQSYLS